MYITYMYYAVGIGFVYHNIICSADIRRAPPPPHPLYNNMSTYMIRCRAVTILY